MRIALGFSFLLSTFVLFASVSAFAASLPLGPFPLPLAPISHAPIPAPTLFNPALLPTPAPVAVIPTPTPKEPENKTSVTDKSTFPPWLGAMGEMVVNGHWSFAGGYGNTFGTFSNAIGSVVASMTEQSSYQSLLHRESGSVATPRLAFEYRQGKGGFNFGLALYYFSSTGGIDDNNTLQAATGIDFTSIKNMLAAQGGSGSIYSSSHIFDFELHTGYTFLLAEHLRLEFNAGVAKILMSTVHLYSNSSAVDTSAAAKNLYQNAQNELESILSKYGLAPMTSLSLRLNF